MKLSREEERFLDRWYRWIYDETHYEEGPGPAKRIQLEQPANPADLFVIIAAAIPSPAEQERIALSPAVGRVAELAVVRRRIPKARSALGVRQEL